MLDIVPYIQLAIWLLHIVLICWLWRRCKRLENKLEQIEEIIK